MYLSMAAPVYAATPYNRAEESIPIFPGACVACATLIDIIFEPCPNDERKTLVKILPPLRGLAPASAWSVVRLHP